MWCWTWQTPTQPSYIEFNHIDTAVVYDVEYAFERPMSLLSCMMWNMAQRENCHSCLVWCGIWHREANVTTIPYDAEYNTEKTSQLSCMMWNIAQRGQCHYYPVWCAIWHKETSVTILSCMMWNKAQKGQCHSCLVWCRIWHREANVTAVLYDAE